MNSRDRFHGFVSRSRIDRVPIQLQNLILAAHAAGEDLPVVYRSPGLVAKGHVLEWEKYRHDAVIVDIGTHAAAESLGCVVEYAPGELPRIVRGAVGSWEEIEDLEVPDIRSTAPLPVVIEAVRELKKSIGNHAVILGSVDQGPFSLATQIVGLEKMLLALATGEANDSIQALLQFCTRFTLAYGIELAEAGADVVRMGDSISGTDLISPAMYRSVALPCQRTLSDEFRRAGIIFDFHICGNATPILHDMVSAGAAFLEIDEKTDMTVARGEVSDRCGIAGAISPRLLRFGAVSEVENACRQLLGGWMPQGGLMLGPGCSLVAETPEENLRAMIRCGQDVGRYSA
jgi:MtaA/CmuA family methyltransferase